MICNAGDEAAGEQGAELETSNEGCLSLARGVPPSWLGPITKPAAARIKRARPVVVEGTGLLARCLQHETDHLNGTVFGDRLAGQARKKLYELHEDAGGGLSRTTRR